MEKTKIGIVGYGYVGKAFARMFDKNADKYEVRVFDPFTTVPNDVPEIQVDENGINECDLGVIAVPTPSNEDGSCDTSIVEGVAEWLETPVILVKSTVEIGTTDKLKAKTSKRIVFSPEYVGEGKYEVTGRMDFQTSMAKTPFLICGGDEDDCSYVFDILVPILGPEKYYYQCKAIDAETVKYMENTYFAVKITFAQEMYDICKAVGANWHKVREGWGLDPRVDKMHTAIFPKARGFSGKCLPKDTNALVGKSIKCGYKPTMISAMLESNAEIREDEPVRVKFEGNESIYKRR